MRTTKYVSKIYWPLPAATHFISDCKMMSRWCFFRRFWVAHLEHIIRKFKSGRIKRFRYLDSYYSKCCSNVCTICFLNRILYFFWKRRVWNVIIFLKPILSWFATYSDIEFHKNMTHSIKIVIKVEIWGHFQSEKTMYMILFTKLASKYFADQQFLTISWEPFFRSGYWFIWQSKKG